MYIHQIRSSSGEWLEDPEDIGATEVEFFQQLLSNSGYLVVDDSQLWVIIPLVISDLDNLGLEAILSSKEVQAIVFGMNGDSIAGPNGFNGHFFTSVWDIISKDVVRAMQDFFVEANLPVSFIATLVALIPTVTSPSAFSDFRPISMCNFVYKIIAKLLVVQLEQILPKIISL